LEVDIVKEVGSGNVLHKWIEFELRDEVIFINGTLVLQSYSASPQRVHLPQAADEAHIQQDPG
jgi:hypothetical protein